MGENSPAKRHAGKMAYHSGLAAEALVERAYLEKGYKSIAQRWRGTGGEIDLIFETHGGLVFVEVKKSKNFNAAAESISKRQVNRIFAAASEFVAKQPAGQLSQMRFDVALCNQYGALKIMENALFCD